MKTIALLGHPVAHSISPRFQQAALDAAGIEAHYEAWDVAPEALPAAVERLRSGDVLGANITVPHKVAMMRHIDRLDVMGERVGAVNTIVNRNGMLHASNTDVAGVLRSLEAAGVAVRGMRVLLIGAGGAARAVVVAMREAGAGTVTVGNRTLANAEALRPLAGETMPLHTCLLAPSSAHLRQAMGTAELVIHATSLGMRDGPDEQSSAIPGELFRAGQTAFDLVTVPERTPFLAAAEQAGTRTIGGLAMLVHQGAESFRLWTGQEAPLEVMMAAVREASGGPS